VRNGGRGSAGDGEEKKEGWAKHVTARRPSCLPNKSREETGEKRRRRLRMKKSEVTVGEG